ncbi:unnamed protein product [Symbiodinium natans]|uniref:Uncharacterized protein n=1 Tax=Symbiodinium natans TaxID=878477 RepID=A0A812PMM6_9DINO|nr:unnamed protein product [Symbiodinium natans]
MRILFLLALQGWMLAGLGHEVLEATCDEAALLQKEKRMNRSAASDGLAGLTSRLASSVRALGLGLGPLADSLKNFNVSLNVSVWQAGAFPELVQQLDRVLEDIRKEVAAALRRLEEGLVACNGQLRQELGVSTAADIPALKEHAETMRSCTDSSVWTWTVNASSMGAVGGGAESAESAEWVGWARRWKKRPKAERERCEHAWGAFPGLFQKLRVRLVSACSSYDVCWAEAESAHKLAAASTDQKWLAYEATRGIIRELCSFGNCTEGDAGEDADSAKVSADLAAVTPARQSCELAACIALSAHTMALHCDASACSATLADPGSASKPEAEHCWQWPGQLSYECHENCRGVVEHQSPSYYRWHSQDRHAQDRRFRHFRRR